MGSFGDLLLGAGKTFANVLTGGAAGGILNLLGGGSSAAQDYEQELAERNREWQAEQNTLDRKFQAEQSYLNFARNRDEWTRQFDLTNAYNNPSAIAARLKAANINPQSMAEGVTNAASSPSFSGAGSVPSGGHGFTPSSIGSSVVAGMFSQPEKLANAFNAIAQGSKTSEEVQHTKSQMLADIRSKLAEGRFEEIKAEREEFELELRQLFGKDYEKGQIALQSAQTQLAFNEALLALKNGEKVDLEKFNIEADSLLKKAQTRFTDEQVTQLQELLSYRKAQLQEQVNLLREQEETERSKQEENRASAAHHRASAWNESVQASTQEALKPYVVRLAKINADIAQNEFEVKKSTTQIRIKQAAAELVRLNLANEELKVKIDLLIKEKKWFELNQIVKIMESVSRSYMNTSIGSKVNSDNVRDWILMPSKMMNGASSAASNMELIGLFM